MTAEIFGYVASVLVAASLVMASFVKLRVINLAGSLSFVVYGALIGSIPIVITNAFIVCVNVYHLFRIFRSDLEGFTYVSLDESKRYQLDQFVDAYRNDITKFYPDFALSFLDDAFSRYGSVYLALHKLRSEGFAFYVRCPRPEGVTNPELKEIFAYVEKELYPEQSIYMPVDYITAKYRDLGLVHQLHKQLLHDVPSEVKFMISICGNDTRRTKKFYARTGHVLKEQFGNFSLYVKPLS